MHQPTTIDAGFLKAEDANRNVSLAVGGLATIEGPVRERLEVAVTGLVAISKRRKISPSRGGLSLVVGEVGIPGFPCSAGPGVRGLYRILL